MNDVRKIRVTVPTMATVIFIVTGIWHLALILNLRDVRDFAGLHFFWTAALGLGPFICLALTSLLAESYIRSNHAHTRLVLAALTAGLSPWLWWIVALWLGIN